MCSEPVCVMEHNRDHVTNERRRRGVGDHGRLYRWPEGTSQTSTERAGRGHWCTYEECLRTPLEPGAVQAERVGDQHKTRPTSEGMFAAWGDRCPRGGLCRASRSRQYLLLSTMCTATRSDHRGHRVSLRCGQWRAHHLGTQEDHRRAGLTTTSPRSTPADHLDRTQRATNNLGDPRWHFVIHHHLLITIPIVDNPIHCLLLCNALYERVGAFI